MRTYFHYLPRLSPFIAGAFFAAAVFTICHQISHYHIKHIGTLITNVPLHILLKAFALTALGYICVIFYDFIGLRYIQREVAVRNIFLTAFIAFAITHNVGHSLFAGTSVRYRFYFRYGISGMEVFTLSLVNCITYGLGMVSVFLITYGFGAPSYSFLPIAAVHGIAWVLVTVSIVYMICVSAWRPVLLIKGLYFHLPSVRLTLLEIGVGSLDIFLSGFVLYVLLAATMPIPLHEFFITYVLALALGLFSQIPGGMGVFEGMFIHLLCCRYPITDIMASLILYRLIYYFLPLITAGILLVIYEMKMPKQAVHPPIFGRGGHENQST